MTDTKVDEALRHKEGWRTIRHFAYVARPYDAVWPKLVESPGLVLGGGENAAAPSSDEGELHAHLGGIKVSRSITMRLGGVVCDDNLTRLAVRWADTRHPVFFPVLDALISLAPVTSGGRPMTRVGIVGRYRPPFGPVGALGDRILGQGIAGESVAGFVDDLARRLEAMADEAAPDPQKPPSADG